MLPPTTSRVAAHTSDHINREIRERTERNVRDVAAKGSIAIHKRLGELEREWDIERTLEANAATLMLAGLGMGATVDRKWFILPAVVSGFLLQHALQGWCPPVFVFRRMGIRTADEIAAEKYALKALRGDFDAVSDRNLYQKPDVEKVVEAVKA